MSPSTFNTVSFVSKSTIVAASPPTNKSFAIEIPIPVAVYVGVPTDAFKSRL